MHKIVWVCLLFYNGSGGSYSPAVATVTDLATIADCKRVGDSWRRVQDYGNNYHCIQVDVIK